MRKHQHHSKSRAKQRAKKRFHDKIKLLHRREREEQQQRDEYVTEKYGERAHNMCGRKIRYRSKSSALARASRCSFLGGASLRAYNCPYCNGWHLTSSKKLGDN